MIADLPNWAKFIFAGLCVLGIWGYVELAERFTGWYGNYVVSYYKKLEAKRKADLELKRELRRKRKADLAYRRNRK